MKAKLKQIYEQHYKKLQIIPILLLVFAIGQLVLQYTSTGDLMNKGISLKGGSTITVPYHQSIDLQGLETQLQQEFPEADLSIRTLSAAGKTVGYTVESNVQSKEDIAAVTTILKSVLPFQDKDFSVEVVDSSLGESFFIQTAWALLFAFIFMGIVVFIYTRSFLPSVLLILATVSNLVATLAIFNLTGEKLGTGGIAAFLMLVGYSVDAEILLASRVVKRKEGTTMDRIYSAIGTGMTMTLATLVAVTAALIFVNNEVVHQIMLILFIGLFVDMINTWIQNVGLLRSHLEKKKQPKHGV